jgi:hypothetical protein
LQLIQLQSVQTQAQKRRLPSGTNDRAILPVCSNHAYAEDHSYSLTNLKKVDYFER